MNNKPLCPECGGVLSQGVAEGLCTRCLVAQGLNLGPNPSSEEAASESGLPRSFGDYELLEEIARGGMGVIYRARQRSLDRTVAVKALLFGPRAGAEQIKRFRAEASVAASLQHPNIVAIHEVGVHQGEHYLVMDLVDGPNLAKFIKDEPLPPQRAARYLKIIAESVQYAHDKGILHRDLKPSNVLIDSTDEPRVTDFGLAKRLDGDSSLTLSGQVVGSPSYMPPEQAGASRHRVSRSSDVYALGAMLYHMLVGRPPFVSPTLDQTLDQVLHREPVAPRLLNPAVPRDLETICLKCLEKEPTRRYSSAQALADELERFLQKKPIHARPVALPEKLWRWCRRRPALAGLILLVHLVGLAGLAGILAQWRLAEQNLYVANVHFANEALEANDLAPAQHFLEKIDHSPAQRAMRGWEWRYLQGLAQGDQALVLDGADAPVWDLASSPDGRWLASITKNGRVKLWDFFDKRLVTNWTAYAQNESGPTSFTLTFTPDARTLITGAYDHLRYWQVPDGQKHGELASPAGHLALTRDGRTLASASEYGGEVWLWDLSSNQPALLHRFNVGLTVLESIRFAPDGRTLLIAGPGAQWVRRYNVADPTVPIRMPDLEDSDGPLAISPDGRWLVTARSDALPFRLWELPLFKPVRTHIVGGRLACVTFSPDSQTLALGLKDGRIVLWKLEAVAETVTLLGHQRSVMQMVFSPDGTTLASASLDKTICLWNTRRPERGKWSFHVPGRACEVSFSPDSKRLASICQIYGRPNETNEPIRTSVTQLWELDERRGLLLKASATNVITQPSSHVVFSPDGNLIAVDDCETLRFLSVPALDPVFATNGWLPCWPTNGSWFAHYQGRRILRGESILKPQRELVSMGEIDAMAVSPDGGILASCSETNNWNIQLWNADDGRPLGKPLSGHSAWVSCICFSPDGRTLVSTGWDDGQLGFWDVPNRKLRSMVPGHHGDVYKAAFSPDSATLATCGADDTIQLWNVARMQEVALLRGHKAPVNGVAFSPDGRWLASASTDGTIRLWQAPTFEELGTQRMPH
jgi:WD40 repeat protein